MKKMISVIVAFIFLCSQVQSKEAKLHSTLPRMSLQDLAPGLNQFFKSLKTTKKLFEYLASAPGSEQKAYLYLAEKLPNQVLPEVIFEKNKLYLRSSKGSYLLELNERNQLSVDGISVPEEKKTPLEVMSFFAAKNLSSTKKNDQSKNWLDLFLSPSIAFADQGAIGPLERVQNDLLRPISDLYNRALGQGSETAAMVIAGGLGTWAAAGTINLIAGSAVVPPAIPVAVVVGILAYLFVFKNRAYAAEGPPTNFRCVMGGDGEFRMKVGGRDISYERRKPENTHPGQVVYQTIPGGASVRCPIQDRAAVSTRSDIRIWQQGPCTPIAAGLDVPGSIIGSIVSLCKTPRAQRDHTQIRETLGLLREQVQATTSNQIQPIPSLPGRR